MRTSQHSQYRVLVGFMVRLFLTSSKLRALSESINMWPGVIADDNRYSKAPLIVLYWILSDMSRKLASASVETQWSSAAEALRAKGRSATATSTAAFMLSSRHRRLMPCSPEIREPLWSLVPSSGFHWVRGRTWHRRWNSCCSLSTRSGIYTST